MRCDGANWYWRFAKLSAGCVQAVEITGTGLRTLPRRTFADLPALQVLDLRNNALAHIDPAGLIGIPTLRDVYLAGNQYRFLAFSFPRLCGPASSFASVTLFPLISRVIQFHRAIFISCISSFGTGRTDQGTNKLIVRVILKCCKTINISMVTATYRYYTMYSDNLINLLWYQLLPIEYWVPNDHLVIKDDSITYTNNDHCNQFT